jgi:hypothetical protein
MDNMDVYWEPPVTSDFDWKIKVSPAHAIVQEEGADALHQPRCGTGALSSLTTAG